MKLIIFSDILDPWGFGFEKDLRALLFLYPEFNYEFNMIGLMSNYEEFLPENFRKFNSHEMGDKIIYDMFIATSTMTKMPSFKKVPLLFNDDIKGSDILNKYFVTVKNLDCSLSNRYIRRVREYMAFLEEDITNFDIQKKILREIGIDILDFNEEFLFSDENYLQDKMFSFDYRIKNAPAFLISEKNRVIKKFLDFNSFCQLLEEEMNLKKIDLKNTEEEVYEFLDRFENVLLIELKLIFREDLIDEMIGDGKIIFKDYGNVEIVKRVVCQN